VLKIQPTSWHLSKIQPTSWHLSQHAYLQRQCIPRAQHPPGPPTRCAHFLTQTAQPRPLSCLCGAGGHPQDERTDVRVYGATMLAALAAADAPPVTAAAVCAAGLPATLCRLLAGPCPPSVRAAVVMCLRRLSLFAACRVRALPLAPADTSRKLRAEAASSAFLRGKKGMLLAYGTVLSHPSIRCISVMCVGWCWKPSVYVCRERAAVDAFSRARAAVEA
jgi:hypothetical protein